MLVLTMDDARATFARLPAMQRGLETFTPWDNIPWEAQAEQLLRCPLGGSFLGLRPAARVEREVAALVERMGLASGSAVLDLGCGPGLHGNRLGALGHRVTGIDIAQAVVDYAQAEANARGLPCAYRRLSFFEMEFDGAFDGAYLVNSVFNQLGEDERHELFRRTARALVPGGVFAFEVDTAIEGEVPPVQRLYSLPSSPWSDRPHYWLERIMYFGVEQQRVTHHLILDADGAIREHWSRSHLPRREALARSLERCGFAVRAWLDQDVVVVRSR
jgi:SAM-dependent methyltransferase